MKKDKSKIKGQPVKVFFLEPTPVVIKSLGRREGGQGKCLELKRLCRAQREIERIEAAELPISGSGLWPNDDPRWPTTCEGCGREFTDQDRKYLDHDRLYRRTDTGETMIQDKFPPGACWSAPWYEDHYIGPDGRCLVVRLPDGHDWIIDSQASNCTKPGDKSHRCWVRTGRPEDGTLDVGKGGNTCSAGKGSIKTTGYHGFLRNGYLVET